MVNPLASFGVPGFAWDVLAAIVTLLATIGVVFLVGILHRRGRIHDDMLLITSHVFAAPAATITWLLYSNEIQSRYLASLTPIIFSLLFVGILSGAIKNRALVGMLTTSDDLNVLRAPLIYSFLIAIFTIIFWPVPFDGMGQPRYDIIVPTMLLVLAPWTGGWGAGHYANRMWGRRRIRVLEDRSVEGFLAMFVFGVLSCYIMLGMYQILFYWQYTSAIALLSPNLLITIIVISLVAAILELFSPSIYDNAIIPLSIVLCLAILGLTGIFPYALLNI